MSDQDKNSVTFYRHKFVVDDNTLESLGHVTAAVRVNNSESGGTPTFDVAFSFCSPKDQFTRAKGRELAAKRLIENLCVERVTTEEAELYTGVVFAALKELVRRYDNDGVRDVLPQRFVRRNVYPLLFRNKTEAMNFARGELVNMNYKY